MKLFESVSTHSIPSARDNATAAGAAGWWLHAQPVSFLAAAATARRLSSADLGALRLQLAAYAAAAILALIVATALSVYKPRGVTPFGMRRRPRRAALAPQA